MYDTRTASSYRRRTGGSGGGSRGGKKDKLHSCWKCGKAFLSRFYLDLHLEACGSSSSSGDAGDASLIDGEGVVVESINDNSPMVICPANDLCSELGGGLKRCKRQALETEPFYARGAVDNPATKLFHERNVFVPTNPTPPHESPSSSILTDEGIGTGGVECNPDEMTKRRHACHQTFGHLCFHGREDLIRNITMELCDGVWTCNNAARHNRHRGDIHSLVYSQPGGIHHSKEEWEMHQDQVGSSPFMVFLTVLGLVRYYGGDGGGGGSRKRKEKTFHKKKKL